MRSERVLAASLAFAMCSLAAAGKDKKKVVIPADVLQARTVLVVIDPDAGVSLEAPNANRTALESVQRALMKWGRFEMALDLAHADLVITVRRGSGKIVQPTIGGIPNNRRDPVIFQPTDTGGRAGGSRGTPPMDGGSTAPGRSNPNPQLEAGPQEDTFVVFRGNRQDATNAPAVWRYSAKGALDSPGVPAVDAFRKAIQEAEKQLNAQP